MDWNSVYKSKVVDIDKVLNMVRSNQTIVVGMTPAEPRLFLRNLHKIADKVNNVTVFTCLNMENYSFYMGSSLCGIFTNASWYFGQSNREAVKAGFGTVTYVPNNLHQAGTNLLDSRPIDIFVGIASPMDKNGFLTLSASVVYEKDVIEQAKVVILEVNPNAPRTHGDTHIHIKDVNYVIEADYELPQVELVEPTQTEALIAQHISNLIEDGSTIQLGIGGIPNAVAKFLTDKKDLGVHTEMFTESMIDLFEAGVITNKKKSIWRDKFICTFAFGTRRMYQFIDDNPSVFFLRGKYVNDPYVICQNDKMVSINTALMVDLTGNVCSEALGTQHYSGTGGQLDTHRGAIKSKGGKGIIALRSTAKNGTVSTIVPTLPVGSPITVPRQEVDYIVTEWGVAWLRGKTIKERARALIEIAHPDFRETLKNEAIKLQIL